MAIDEKPKRSRKRPRKTVVDVSQAKPIETRHVGPKGSVFTEQARIEIKAHLQNGLPRYYACAQAGIAERTLRKWMRKGEENLEEIDVAIAEGRDPPELSPWGEFARDVLRIEAEARSMDVQFIRNADDWRARAWYLERMDHRRWNAPNKHQMMAEGEDGEPVDAGSLLLEQLNIMAERIGRASSGPDEDG